MVWELFPQIFTWRRPAHPGLANLFILRLRLWRQFDAGFDILLSDFYRPIWTGGVEKGHFCVINY